MDDPDSDDFNACTIDSCSGGACIHEYANLVSMFPYSESFKSGLGAWSNITGEQFDWTRMSGSTTSLYTGPAGAHGVTYYLYTESSSPHYPGMTATLEGPNIDLTNASQAQLPLMNLPLGLYLYANRRIVCLA